MKNIEEVKDEVAEELEAWRNVEGGVDDEGIDTIMVIIDQLDEPEVLSQNWIDEHVDYADVRGGTQAFIHVEDLQNLLVPEQEVLSDEQIARKVDQAYKDGYEIGKKHAFEKAGLEDKDKEPETVASVIADFYKSLERLKEVLGMEVEELEE